MVVQRFASWYRGLPAPLIDSALAVLSYAVVTMVITVATEPGARHPDALAYALAVAVAAPVAVRRRWPRTCVLVAAWALNTYYALQYPGFSPFLALAVPLYTAAVTGHLVTGGIVAAWVVVSGAVFRGYEGESVLRLVPDTLIEAALVIGLLVLGEGLRARRLLRAEVAERLARTKADAERDAERRLMTERLRVARDLHDVLAHTIAVIGVQADVAAELLDDDPGRARTAIQTIREAGRHALADLRNTIGVLRTRASADEPRPPAPGLADLDALVSPARAAGLSVNVDVRGQRPGLPPSVDLTAYRVVQESLTNVLRHANASQVDVVIDYLPSSVDISVTDDGTAAATGSHTGGSGHGLLGMRERVSALGGTIIAAPGPAGGFTVSTHLPLER